MVLATNNTVHVMMLFFRRNYGLAKLREKYVPGGKKLGRGFIRGGRMT